MTLDEYLKQVREREKNLITFQARLMGKQANLKTHSDTLKLIRIIEQLRSCESYYAYCVALSSCDKICEGEGWKILK